MRPPLPTTFDRMRTAAARRATEIERIQARRVDAGLSRAADEEALLERDDFDAMVRLMDVIMADRELQDRIARAGSARGKAK